MASKHNAPSLFQEREEDERPQRRKERHAHQHQYRDAHGHMSLKPIERRQSPDPAPVVTEIVQTVSVVQYIDQSGNVFSVQSLTGTAAQPAQEATPTPAAQDAAPDTPAPFVGDVVSQTPSPAPAPAPVETPVEAPPAQSIPPSSNLAHETLGDGVSVSLPLTNLLPSADIPTTSTSTSLPLSIPSSVDSSSASVPSTTLSSFHSFPTTWNSSIPTTSSGFSNSTFIRSLFANVTTSASSDASTDTTVAPTTTTLTDLSSWQSSGSDSRSTITDSTGGIVVLSTAVGGVPPSSTTTDGATGGSTLPNPPVPTSTVVGGVVGGVAGLAVVVLAAMLFLRWKRRHDSGLRLLNDGNRSHSFTGDNRGLGGGPSGHSVAERLLPFAVPAPLAALAGQKRLQTPPSAPSDQSPDSPGRSFYRVSGKKLTSVLESGGDGYSDPPETGSTSTNNNSNSEKRNANRNTYESAQSASSYYRDSYGWYGDPNHLPQLQLGSPIPRPDDGFPIMRASPARTPVTEEGPLRLPRQTAPGMPVGAGGRDGVGRSLTGQDGSGSGRFTENL